MSAPGSRCRGGRDGRRKVRFRDVHVDWECERCHKAGEFDIIRGKGLPWHVVSERIEAEHKAVSPGCTVTDMTSMKINFRRAGEEPMATETEAAQPLDFHIYVKEGSVQTVLDENDPQREELMRAWAEIFNNHKRYRESDECNGIGING